MSSIYAGGVRATAVSNILSAINSRIVTQADGSLTLDVQSLTSWVTDQLYQMVTDGEATSSAYIGALLSEAQAAIQNAANVIDPSHWRSRPDWPGNTPTASSQQTASVAGVIAQQGKLKNLAAAATAFFADTPQLLADTLTDYFNSNIASDIDPGVTLLEENRAYVCTYTTDRGEESAWSPVSELIQCDQNDTVTVTVPAPPSGRFIEYFQLLRSSTTNTSEAYQYVPNPADDKGWPIGTLTVTDTAKQAELQRPGRTQLWDEPPADLRGIVGDANGGMAGFTGNQFCPCVPYVPYAFPAAMRKTTEWPIVGLACIDTTYFVGTRGRPYIMPGADTQSLGAIKIEADEPCVSKRGIVAMRGGYYYPSPNGLCLCTPGGAIKVITGPDGFDVFDLETWAALDPSSIVATEYQGAYLFRWNNGVTSGAYMLDVVTGKLVAVTLSASAFFRDSITGRPYAASGTAINALFASATKRTAIWKTPIIALDDYPSFSWLQAQSAYEGGGTITVSIYADGELIQTENLTSREPVRVVEGAFREWEVQVQSTCGATSVTLAENTEGLKAL